MSNTPSAATLRTRIEALEAQRAAQAAKVAELEARLSDAYANGTSPASALAGLASARDELAGMDSALTTLDGRLYEVSTAEHSETIAKARAEVEEGYLITVGELRRALGQVDLLVQKHCPSLNADPSRLATFWDDALERVWLEFYTPEIAAKVAAFGPRPSAPLPRKAISAA